ncbi:S-layer homology domain-containing protein [Paenibacillus vini]|uniref:fibronectin type III domain-containing protein n=1 Tax=Paenibacillus vini TaxID=1476024 RepID=UPI0025B6DD7D|nr:S-layer homology domain-containing protein [Paenibacillus vini]MDN4067581.1 S-layer homology domain-containing protein [Paenibacillus vini]
MNIIKRIYNLILSVAIVIPGTILFPIGTTSAAAAPPNFTSVYQKDGHVKLEWAAEMDAADILTQTGFESGQEIPSIEWGGVGKQSFETVSGQGKVLQINDTITNWEGNIIDPPWVPKSPTSRTTFDGRSIPSDSTISFNFKARAIGGTENQLLFYMDSGWTKYGSPLKDYNDKYVLYDQLVDWNNSPEYIKVKTGDGSPVSFPDGFRPVFVSAKNGNYDYAVLHYEFESSNQRFKKSRSGAVPFTGSSPIKPWNTPTKLDAFRPGDQVLYLSQYTFTMPARTLPSDGQWQTISANTYIPYTSNFDPNLRGMWAALNWQTNGILQLDDLKIGYATEVEVYRDNASIYRGYLSDFEDLAATDKGKPTAPSNVVVTMNNGIPSASWSAATDTGTTYNYKIKGYPKKSAETALSVARPITITTGIKGYSVIFDQNSNTIPPATVNVSGTSFTGSSTFNSNYYAHIAAIDNAGNISDVAHYLYMDTVSPELQLAQKNTGWTNGQVQIIANAYDSGVGVKRIKLPDGSFISDDTAEYVVSSNGTYTFIAEDNSWNKTEKSISISNIDTSKPVIEVSPNGRSWSSDPINLSISVNDLLSGLKPNSTYYKVTASPQEPANWELFTDPSEPIQITQEGTWYLHVKATDRAGNTQQVVSGSYQMQQAPVVPTQFTATNVQHDEVTLTWDLPTGNALTDGIVYQITNLGTGSSYRISYPENRVTDRSVQGGQSYDYSLTIQNNVGGAEATQLTVLTKPDAPTLIRVEKSDRDYSSAELFIDSIPGVDEYHLVIKDSTGGVVVDDTIVTPYYTISNFQAGMIYSLTVSGRNAAGEGPSKSMSYLSLPDVPGGFTSAQIGVDHIRLQWQRALSAITYHLLRGELPVYTGPDMSFEDTGLQSGTEYGYQIAAENETGEGDYAYLPDLITLPEETRGLQSQASIESLRFTWNEVRGAEGFLLSLSDGQQATVTGSTYNYTFEGLTAGTEYNLNITAQNRSGEGSTSSYSTFTLPVTPMGLQASKVEETVAEIHWDPVPGANKYRVAIAGQSYEVSSAHIVLSTLQGSKTYEYSVTAGNNSGYGESASDTFMTKPHAPSNLRVKELGTEQVTLIWDKDVTATKYIGRIQGTDDQESKTEELTFKGLEPGQNYTFSIGATNISGDSGLSVIQVVTRTLPIAVEDITVEVEHEQATIDFKPVEHGEDYVLLDENGTEVWRGNEGPIVISSITPGKDYDFAIIVENGQGAPSDGTPIHFVAIPGSPEGISLTEVSEISVTFDLSKAVKNGATEIVLYRDGKKIDRIDAGEEKYSDKALKANQTYEYEFKAANASGESREGVKLNITTKPEPASGADGNSGGGGGSTAGPITKPESPKPTETNLDESEGESGTKPENSYSPSDSSNFQDVSSASFAKEAIDYLVEQKIVKGVTDKMFEPNRPISRMEFAALIVRAIKAGPDATLEITYQDINQTGWYMTELNAAISNNVAIGFSKNEFKPLLNIDREQAAKMLGNVVIQKFGMDDDSGYTEFMDSSHVSEWASNEVNLISSLKILEGYPDGSFKPQGNLTRAESAVLIYRMLYLQK